MPTCPACSSSSPSEGSAGVDACPSCGATRVWPQTDTAGHASIPDADLQVELRRCMLRHGVLPWTVPLVVEGQEDLRRIYARACWTIERRVPTLRMLAAIGRQAQAIAALPDPNAVDVWASEPEPIRLQTQCVTRCPPCRGSGRVDCPTCRGSSRVPCRTCGGDGQLQREDQVEIRNSNSSVQWGTVKRTEQCLPCRGTGKLECESCEQGKVVCMQCDGSTLVEAWIEVSVERMGQVRVEADFEVEAMHPAIGNSDDFDTPAERLPAELIADSGLQLPDAITNCPATLRVMLDTRTDRVRGVRVQQLRAPGVRINVATRLARDVVEFVGRPPQLVSGPMRALQLRARLGVGLGLTVLALGLVAVVYYGGRSPWFAVHGRGGMLAMLAVLTGGLVGALVLGATLPNLRRSVGRWAAPLAGLLLTIALAIEVWGSAEPDLLTARAAIEQGDLERAEEELEALTQLGRDAGLAELRVELRAAHGHQADRERLARLQATEAFDERAEILRESWSDTGLRDEQIADHARRARAAIDDAWTGSRAAVLDEIVAGLRGLDAALAAEASTLAKLLALRSAIGDEPFETSRSDLDGIATSDATADEHAIVEAELRDAIAAAARRHYALGFDVERRDTDRAASLDRFEALAELHETITGMLPSEVDRERAAAEAKQLGKAIEKARIAAERKRKAELRRPGGRVICNDGTYSDSCSCSERQESCCSGHDGVAGCG